MWAEAKKSLKGNNNPRGRSKRNRLRACPITADHTADTEFVGRGIALPRRERNGSD